MSNASGVQFSVRPFIAAAVQAAPVFLDAQATTEKACKLIREAANNGAKLVAFPEVYIPGYPYWAWIMDPRSGQSWFKKLFLNSIYARGPEVELLQREAQRNDIIVVIGINERSPNSMGTIYNTNLIINSDGALIGRHRKIVPTFAEKLIWGSGDGSSIVPKSTKIGKLGSLACGENTNTLARFALLAQGENIHVANYVAFPGLETFDIVEGIKIRAGAHSFEGKLFTIVSSSTISDEMIDILGDTPENKEYLSRKNNAFSGIFGPEGTLISKGIHDIEGIDYAEIDLDKCITPKLMHDIIGHYNRFDIFQVKLNGRLLNPNLEPDLVSEDIVRDVAPIALDENGKLQEQ